MLCSWATKEKNVFWQINTISQNETVNAKCEEIRKESWHKNSEPTFELYVIDSLID